MPHTCGKICNYKICDHQTCALPCHPGPHLQCQKTSISTCYCEKETKEVVCYMINKIHKDNTDVSRYTCQNTCGKKLKCGYHTCTFKCHEGDCPGNYQNEEGSNENNCESCFDESKQKLTTIIKDLEILCLEVNIKINLLDPLLNFIFYGKLPCNIHYIDC